MRGQGKFGGLDILRGKAESPKREGRCQGARCRCVRGRSLVAPNLGWGSIPRKAFGLPGFGSLAAQLQSICECLFVRPNKLR